MNNKILSQITKEEALSKYNGKDKIVSSFEKKKEIEASKEKFFYVYSKIPTLDKSLNGFESGEMIIIAGATGQGKCFGKGTEILMFDGSIKKVEDIKVGDKLMGDDGSPRTVLFLGRGREMMYKVTLKDGSSFVCNESHILALQHTGIKTGRRKKFINISLKDYLKASKTLKHLYKMYKKGVEFPEKELEIDPYFLGLWLGDGHSESAAITTADKEIVDYLYKFAEKNNWKVNVINQPNNKSKIYQIVRPKKFPPVNKRNKKGYGGAISLQEKLRKLNLIKNKHIPLEYKINSSENRLRLLAGLIDSDGYSNSAGVNFCNKNKKLCEDVIFVARSLGFYASMRTKIVNSVPYYIVYINGKDLNKIPILLKRKIRKNYKPITNSLLQCFKIERIGIDDYYGFEIDGNNLFLLANFTVVHNTTFAQYLTNAFAEQQIKSLWFSYEVAPHQFFDKFENLPLFYLPNILAGKTLQWIEDRIIEAKVKYEVKVVFIDHLHYLLNFASINSVTPEIDYIVRNLKLLCLKHNLIIFLLCHLAKVKVDEELENSHLRNSAMIAGEADTVLMIRRDKNEENKSILKITKSRRVGVMDKKIPLLYKGKARFEEITNEVIPEIIL